MVDSYGFSGALVFREAIEIDAQVIALRISRYLCFQLTMLFITIIETGIVCVFSLCIFHGEAGICRYFNSHSGIRAANTALAFACPRSDAGAESQQAEKDDDD